MKTSRKAILNTTLFCLMFMFYGGEIRKQLLGLSKTKTIGWTTYLLWEGQAYRYYDENAKENNMFGVFLKYIDICDREKQSKFTPLPEVWVWSPHYETAVFDIYDPIHPQATMDLVSEGRRSKGAYHRKIRTRFSRQRTLATS